MYYSALQENPTHGGVTYRRPPMRQLVPWGVTYRRPPRHKSPPRNSPSKRLGSRDVASAVPLVLYISTCAHVYNPSIPKMKTHAEVSNLINKYHQESHEKSDIINIK